MPIAFAALLEALDHRTVPRWAWVRSYTRHGAAIAVTAALMLQPGLPLFTLINPAAWAKPPRAEAASAVLAAIPAGASVETDIGLMTYLVDDHEVYWIGNKNPIPDCILIDRIAGGTPGEWGTVLDISQRLHPAADYAVVLSASDYELACRN